MQFFKSLRHTLLSITLAVILSVLGGWFIFGGGTTETQTVSAGFDPYDNISGWAWSQNIGWISFNNKDCDTNNNGYVDVACGSVDDTSVPSKNYTVRVAEFNRFSSLPANTTDPFSGWAWSSNIGWISFNGSDTGTTTSPLAYIDWNTGKVYGWARALSGCQELPSTFGVDNTVGGPNQPSCSSNGPGAASNDWDGWIKLSGIAIDGSTYGVQLVGGNLTGYAWGGDVVDWVRFSGTATDGSLYNVKFTPRGSIAATGCGQANGVPTTTPTVYFCSSGGASLGPTLSTTTPYVWNWKCDAGAISCSAPRPQCSDGIDNDGDGQIDAADSGCSGASDNTERDFKFREF